MVRLHQGRALKGQKKPKYTVIPAPKKKKSPRKFPSDRLILWTKPKRKPKGISQSDFDSNPNDLVVREVRAYICIPGFRTEEITVVTTLLDAWQDIRGYEGYQVSNYGKVKNSKTGKILKPYLTRGYLRVSLYNEYGRKCKLVHRLVAEVFIPNPHCKPAVNHINGCKTDSNVSRSQNRRSLKLGILCYFFAQFSLVFVLILLI